MFNSSPYCMHLYRNSPAPSHDSESPVKYIVVEAEKYSL